MSGLATAIIGSAVVGAAVSSRSASKAAKAQQEASGASIDEQRAQFEAMQRTLKPYVDAGTPALRQIASFSDVAQPALNEQQALIGMFGAEAQQQAINKIEQSPLYLEQVRQGENAILQQASATGGLRGGNIQAALAQFRPAVLSQMIENQYSKLGGMAEFGGQAAQNLATMGQAWEWRQTLETLCKPLVKHRHRHSLLKVKPGAMLLAQLGIWAAWECRAMAHSLQSQQQHLTPTLQVM